MLVDFTSKVMSVCWLMGHWFHQ
nr:hypothetical protein [Salmonella sp.]